MAVHVSSLLQDKVFSMKFIAMPRYIRSLLYFASAISLTNVSFSQVDALKDVAVSSTSPALGLSATEASTWRNLITLQSTSATTPSIEDLTNGKGLGQYKAVAQAAYDFYTKYPQSDKAPLARKTEVVISITGAQMGDADLLKSAPTLAKSYRTDKTVSVKDRLDVALMFDAQGISGQLLGKSSNQFGPIRYTYLSKLRTEFGDIPEIHFLYRNLMLTCERGDPTAITVANELASNNKVSDVIRKEASAFISRDKLIGTKPNLRLVGDNGKTVDFKALLGNPVVLYVWATGWSIGDPSILNKQVQNVPAGTQWVYCSLVIPSAQWRSYKRPAFDGVECNYLTGYKSEVAVKLSLTQCPFVYVFDKAGMLVGFGPQSQLDSLLKEAK